mmetsp:Transcript_38033/g.113595  ORF Transcript_38033/g.113595 Transcript_38033/m.113595 type:complete len:253 (-) Transcript_38033:1603-2361(-)
MTPTTTVAHHRRTASAPPVGTVGLLPALVVLVQVFEGVESDLGAVGARGWSAARVGDHTEVVQRGHPELVEALLHEVVLTPTLPGEVYAGHLAPLVGLNRPAGVDFDGSEHPGAQAKAVAVLQELRRPPRRRVGDELAGEPMRHEDRVGVDLHRPVLIFVQPIRDDGVPHPDEDLCVEARSPRQVGKRAPVLHAVRKLQNEGGHERPSIVVGPHPDHSVVGEELHRVARKDAGLVHQVVPHDARLVGCHGYQ